MTRNLLKFPLIEILYKNLGNVARIVNSTVMDAFQFNSLQRQGIAHANGTRQFS